MKQKKMAYLYQNHVNRDDSFRLNVLTLLTHLALKYKIPILYKASRNTADYDFQKYVQIFNLPIDYKEYNEYNISMSDIYHQYEKLMMMFFPTENILYANTLLQIQPINILKNLTPPNVDLRNIKPLCLVLRLNFEKTKQMDTSILEYSRYFCKVNPTIYSIMFPKTMFSLNYLENWGPQMWRVFHICATTLGITDPDFYYPFIQQIPCPNCQKDFVNDFGIYKNTDARIGRMYTNNKTPISSQSLFEFHNKVNKKLNKQIMSQSSFESMYNPADKLSLYYSLLSALRYLSLMSRFYTSNSLIVDSRNVQIDYDRSIFHFPIPFVIEALIQRRANPQIIDVLLSYPLHLD